MQSHVIFTNGRSGSNFLANLLNDHPSVVNYGEVLWPTHTAMKIGRPYRAMRGTAAYLDALLTSERVLTAALMTSAIERRFNGRETMKKQTGDITTVGIKEFGIRFERAGLSDYLRERPNLLVVSLVRDNTFERMLSVELLRRTGLIGNAHPDAEERQKEILTVPLDHAFERLEVLETERTEQLAMIDGIPEHRLLRLTYEEMLGSPEGMTESAEAMQRFLGVEPRPLESKHRKLRSKTERIGNYDELLAAVSDSKFADVLTRDGSLAPSS